MTKETMTIHKALSELKMLDKRIMTGIKRATFCAANKTSVEKINGLKVDEFKRATADTLKSAEDLIKRRNAIKRAVIISNAETNVKIGGKEYTVAEAIDMHMNSSKYNKMLFGTLEEQYYDAVRVMEEKNANADKVARAYVTELYGGENAANVKSAEIEKTVENVVKANQYDIFTGINCTEYMKELSNKIEAFESEVDSALSVSNATTTIEIEY